MSNPKIRVNKEGACSEAIPGISSCECQGALMPRLVHEMTNQLLIISGSAHIAERSDNDPLAAAQAIKAIRQAAETAGRLLDGYSVFLRKLPRDCVSASVADVVELIGRCAGSRQGWRIDLTGALEGRVAVSPQWIAHAVWQVVCESQAAEGVINLCCGVPRMTMPLSLSAPGPGESGRMLQVILNWHSTVPLLAEDELRKPRNLSLAAIYGLLSSVGGDCHYYFGHPDQNRITLLAPLLDSSQAFE